LILVQRSDGVFLLERDMRRRGAFSLCRDSNAFALIFMLSQLEKNAD